MSENLAGLAEFFSLISDRNERIELLISCADRFSPVADQIATRPYPLSHKVPGCESQVYVWALRRPDGLLDFHFAVENPQGISAMALAAILAESLSGKPLEEILEVSPEIIFRFFGRELSIAKSTGLMNMVERVRELARRELSPRGARSSSADHSEEAGETES